MGLPERVFDQRPVVGQERVWVCFETGWPCASHLPNDPEKPYAFPVHEYVRADAVREKWARVREKVADMRADEFQLGDVPDMVLVEALDEILAILDAECEPKENSMSEQDCKELLSLAKAIALLAKERPGMKFEDSGTIRALRKFLDERKLR